MLLSPFDLQVYSCWSPKTFIFFSKDSEKPPLPTYNNSQRTRGVNLPSSRGSLQKKADRSFDISRWKTTFYLPLFFPRRISGVRAFPFRYSRATTTTTAAAAARKEDGFSNRKKESWEWSPRWALLTRLFSLPLSHRFRKFIPSEIKQVSCKSSGVFFT